MIGLNLTVDIIGITETSDGMGGWKKTKAFKATVPANISPVGQIDAGAVIAGKTQEISTHRILLEPTAPAAIEDEIRHKHRTWRVVGIENFRGHHLEIRGFLL